MLHDTKPSRLQVLAFAGLIISASILFAALVHASRNVSAFI